MRNAIDHDDKPVLAGRAGTGESLSLEVHDQDMTISDLNKRVQTVTYVELADWLRKLHALALELIGRPSQWATTATTQQE